MDNNHTLVFTAVISKLYRKCIFEFLSDFYLIFDKINFCENIIYGFLREKWIGILVSNQPCRPSRISIAAVEPNASFPSKITNKNNFRF